MLCLIAELCLFVARQLETDSSMLVWYSSHATTAGSISILHSPSLNGIMRLSVVDLWHHRHRQIILKHVALPEFIEELLQRW
jgi:hypothetical protein